MENTLEESIRNRGQVTDTSLLDVVQFLECLHVKNSHLGLKSIQIYWCAQ